MKKEISIFYILLFYLNTIKCSSYSDCGNVYNPISKSECQSIEIDEINKCCYVSYKLAETEFTQCVPIIFELKAIKSYGKMLRDADNLKILCSSYKIYVSYFLIICFILLLL